MKTLNNLLATSFILLLLTSGVSQKDDYNIFLTIDGNQYDSAIIGFVPAANRDIEIYDTALIVNGNLKYKFETNEMHEGIIIPFQLFHKFKNGGKYPMLSSKIRFFINAHEIINIKASIRDQIVTYSTEGNTLSKQLAESNSRMTDVYNARMKFEYEFNSSPPSTWTDAKFNSYMKMKAENNMAFTEKNIEFITDHLDYDYSARLLLEIQDKQKVATLYHQLDNKVQQSYYGKLVGSMIAGWGIVAPGLKFPDNLKLNTLEGKPFNLHDHDGKYILFDFWGSWCAPCLSEIPELKKLTEEYNAKLVLIGMICGDSKDKAMNAIEKHNMDWLQLYSDNDDFSKTFGIQAFPTKILIDDKGIIIKEFKGSSSVIFAQIREAIK